MRGMCRSPLSGRYGRLASRIMVRARIVTDPKKLAHLRREAARQRRRSEPVSRVTIEPSFVVTSE